MDILQKNNDYKIWLTELKTKIKNSQIKASLSVNKELILLYWDIGKMITEKQEKAKWGSGFIKQLAKDLKADFPDVKGFSERNLYSARQFYLFYSQIDTNLNQLGADFNNFTAIPWRHHVLILQKIKNITEALFYINKTIENNWSRSVLEYQIETDLYKRQGKTLNNFNKTLPAPESELAQQILKDPYNFDFLTLSESVKEKELENKLVENITKFLLELGNGFAYMGRQFSLKVGSKEFRTDLLFYHTKLHAIIIELKTEEFKPEFTDKLNFYITAVNELLKTENDNDTIGILLCKNKDNLIVDFALKDINKPIGVSEYTYNELPEKYKDIFPDVETLKKLID